MKHWWDYLFRISQWISTENDVCAVQFFGIQYWWMDELWWRQRLKKPTDIILFIGWHQLMNMYLFTGQKKKNNYISEVEETLKHLFMWSTETGSIYWSNWLNNEGWRSTPKAVKVVLKMPRHCSNCGRTTKRKKLGWSRRNASVRLESPPKTSEPSSVSNKNTKCVTLLHLICIMWPCRIIFTLGPSLSHFRFTTSPLEIYCIA